jgi:hypothetical protein
MITCTLPVGRKIPERMFSPLALYSVYHPDESVAKVIGTYIGFSTQLHLPIKIGNLPINLPITVSLEILLFISLPSVQDGMLCYT